MPYVFKRRWRSPAGTRESRWWSIGFHDAAGREHQRKTDPPTTSRKLALEQAEAAERHAKTGAVEAYMGTLAGWIAGGAWDRLQRQVSEGWAKRRRSVIARLIVPQLGGLPLSSVTYSALQDARAAWSAAGHSTEYQNTAIAVLSRILNDAVERGVISASPLVVPRGHRLKTPTPPLALQLTSSEREAFLRAFRDREAFDRRLSAQHAEATRKGREEGRRGGGGIRPGSAEGERYWRAFHRAGELFLVALETGLARSDLLGLTWGRVDLAEGVIVVPRAKTSQLATPPITAEARAVFERRLQEHRERRKAAGAREEDRDPKGNDLVFLTDAGAPWGPTMVDRYFGVAKDLAGITRRLRFHDLRHTFGSTLGRAGLNAWEIQAAMGQADLDSTKRYVVVDRGAVTRAREALEARHPTMQPAASRSGKPSKPHG